MSDNNGVDVKVEATTTGLEAGMRQAAASVQSGVNEIRGHLEGMNAMFGKITAGFALFTAALAGGSALKAFVAGAIESTKEAAALGKTLGITATDASYFKAALTAVGVSSDTVSAAASKITMTLLKNEQAFKDLGVSTRDSNGHLRNTKDLMLDTNEVLRTFKEGTDRNIEGVKIYGRQWAEIAPLVNKFKGETEESRKSAEALNLVVGQEAVSDMANYKMAQIGVKEVMEGVTNTIGREIIPRLTELGNWFRSIGPTAVEVTRIAMQGYLTIQDALKDSVKALWQITSATFQAIGSIATAIFGSGGSAMTAMEFFQNCIKVIQIVFIGFRISVEEACALIVSGIDRLKIVIGGLYEASKLSIEGVLFELNALSIGFEGVGKIAKAALSLDWEGMKAAVADTGARLNANAQNATAAYKGAKDAIVKIGTDMKANFSATMDQMADIATKGAADIDKVLLADLGKSKPVTPIAEKTGGDRSDGGDDPKDKKDKDDRMKQWEAQLLEDKKNYMIENDMREMSLSDEAAYWSKLLGTLKDGDNAKSSVRKKMAETEFADMKRQAKQRLDLQMEVIDFEQKNDLAAVDRDREADQQRLALGLETAEQSLKNEESFEQRKYAIQVKALQDRLALLDKDPTTNLVERQKVLDQLLTMEQKHANDILKIQNKQVLESQKPYTEFNQSVQSSFKNAISGMMQGTLTFSGAMKGLFKGILGAFADMVAGMIVKWIAAMVMNRVSQAATGVAQVASNAAVAASAAFASIAAIPIVGPAMAPGAAAAAYAGTMAFAPLASARNGFDIPAGLNPVTQLHEREMVLPQAQADAVRDMAAGNGGGAAPTIHIHAVDAKSVERLFKNNGRALATSLQNQARNFAIKK